MQIWKYMQMNSVKLLFQFACTQSSPMHLLVKGLKMTF